MFKLNYNFVLLIILILFGCSKNNDNLSKDKESLPPDQLYILAKSNLDKNELDTALELFKEIESKYPLSKESIESKINIAFIYYITLDYDNSIFKLDKIIQRYPDYKSIDYVYYLKAICFYEQIQNPELDGSINLEALKSFEEIISRFPTSKYTKDSKQKILLVKDSIASKNMVIADYYLKNNNYLAALNRYKKVIEEHEDSKYVPEALFRLVEIYYTLGLIEDAKKTASVIGYNFPNSEWYKYSYDIVGEKEDEKSWFNIF